MNTPPAPPTPSAPPLPPPPTGNTVVRSPDGTVVATVTGSDGTRTVTIERSGEPPLVLSRDEGSWLDSAWLILAAAALLLGLVALVRRARRGSAGGLASAPRDLSPERERDLLAAENERLKGQVTRLEERVAVLERIATDPGRRIAAEIDNLR